MGGPTGWVGHGISLILFPNTIRKSLGWANSVSQDDGDSEVVTVCWFCVVGRISEKEQWLLPGLLSGRKLPLQLSP